MKIPFFVAAKNDISCSQSLDRYVAEVFVSGGFTSGAMAGELERAIERFTGIPHAVAVSNGTDALSIMYKAAGIGTGDEVICPVMTFVATASSAAVIGARPVFCDIEPASYALDPTKVESLITSRTKAIVPVHLFQQMADMSELLRIALKHNLKTLEDSAEAIGMYYAGRHAGGLGEAGVISFFPTKTLGALGDAGMIVTRDEAFAQKCRQLANHGRSLDEPAVVELVGYNARLDGLQAAYLLARLSELPRAIAWRAHLASIYDRRLSGLAPWVTIPTRQQRDCTTNAVVYVYLIECDWRDELTEYLCKRGIGTEVYYPIPLHLQPCFRYLGHREGDFPNAERACKRALALPLYSELSEDEVHVVCDAVEAFYSSKEE